MNIQFVIYDTESYEDCEEHIKNSGLEKCRYYNPTTSFLDMQMCLSCNRKLLTIEQIEKRIEDGYVIVPFSKNIYLVDLLKYYNLGLKPCFMSNKAFKIFRKVYKDYI